MSHLNDDIKNLSIQDPNTSIRASKMKSQKNSSTERTESIQELFPNADSLLLLPGKSFRERISNYGRWYIEPDKYSYFFKRHQE
mmetsp:Transcript_32665/g.37293  ORF Transcript_32665/g.37293 Transcript_32665/m.37293 type:complete len:84 (-) Transcript_32665:3-254(-)